MPQVRPPFPGRSRGPWTRIPKLTMCEGSMAAPEPSDEELIAEFRRRLTAKLGSVVGIIGDLVDRTVHLVPGHRDVLARFHERLLTSLEDPRTFLAQSRELAPLDADVRATLG